MEEGIYPIDVVAMLIAERGGLNLFDRMHDFLGRCELVHAALAEVNLQRHRLASPIGPRPGLNVGHDRRDGTSLAWDRG